MAAGEMGCHSATISHTVLEQLSKLPYDASKQPGEGLPKPTHVYKNAHPTPERLKKLLTVDVLAGPDWDGKLASTDVDWLANGGSELDKANEADIPTKKRLEDALTLFIGGEERSKLKVETLLGEI